MTWQEIIEGMVPALPIVLLCVMALIVVMVDWFLSLKQSFQIGWVALICLGVAGAFEIVYFLRLGPKATQLAMEGPVRTFGERLVLDSLGLLFTMFFTLSAFLTVLVSLRARALFCRRLGEYYALIMLATVAMSVVIASRDFLVLYIGIETISLPCYVLAGYQRQDRIGTEAALKYILYGAVASGVMLFGISYVYGLTGTTIIADLYNLPASKTPALAAALMLILGGLGFKMVLVPFHSWCPDVYEGAPTPITAYLSVASKGAGVGALVRVFYPLFCASETGQSVSTAIQQVDPWTVFWVLSAVTMTLGNLVAVWQSNVKRLLAYSSIAHAGYMAMAFSLMNKEAFEALIIYLLVYLVMNLGAFFTVLFIENATGECDLAAYRGLVRRSPLLTTVLTIFLLSLLGIPPTAGFMAKFKMFGALIEESTRPAVALAIVGIVNSVISAYYYLKVVKVMVFDAGEEETAIATPVMDGAIVVALAIAVLALFVFWTPVQTLAGSLPLNATKF